MTVGVLASLTGDTYGVAGGGGSAGSGYTYADATYTILVSDTSHWSSHVSAAGINAIIGVQAGTHSGSKVRNIAPLAGQKFIGQTDGVPTVQFPNGTPTSIIDGQETPNNGLGSRFLAASVNNVVVENLEMKNFDPSHGGGDVLGTGQSENWLIYNNHIHNVERAIKLGINYRVAHNLIEYCRNGSIFSSSWFVQPSGPTYRNGGGTIEDNTFQHVNTAHDPWNISGGEASSKFAGGSNEQFIIRYNTYKDHYGPAVWFDAYLHSQTEQEYAEIYNNYFEDNLIHFKWEIMGVQSADHRVGVNFHHNHLKTTGILFSNEWDRVLPVDINESEGSSLYPIKINDNLCESAHPHRFGAAGFISVNGDGRGITDWLEVQRNTVVDTGTVGPGTGPPPDLEYLFMVGLYSWNNHGGVELWDRNFTIEDNDYTYSETNFGDGEYAFGYRTPTLSQFMNWSEWQAEGWDATGSYTAI